MLFARRCLHRDCLFAKPRSFMSGLLAWLALCAFDAALAQTNNAQGNGPPLQLEVLGDFDGNLNSQGVDSVETPSIGESTPLASPDAEASGWYAEPLPGQHDQHELDTFGANWSIHSLWQHTYCLQCLTRLGLRHSQTHGRHVGLGAPLVGTSWLNRPFFVGAELGEIWIMRALDDHVSRDHDVFGGMFIGCDWDHFWGTDFRVDWATPELKNSTQPDADRADSMFAWSLNALYYPWGDSKFRPYWRWGLGSTHFDFPTADGTRNDEWLFTMPIGIGMKYPLRRWLALRTEFADQFSIGDSGLPTQHNLTITFGLECRYGVHPKSYWPWNPSRHIW